MQVSVKTVAAATGLVVMFEALHEGFVPAGIVLENTPPGFEVTLQLSLPERLVALQESEVEVSFCTRVCAADIESAGGTGMHASPCIV